MPLQTGPNSIRSNVSELMKSPQSAARRKAIITLARKHGISKEEAQMRQALAIAKHQARKP